MVPPPFSRYIKLAVGLGASSLIASFPLCAASGHDEPIMVTDIRFETKVGDGYWPCAFAPFVPDKPCNEEEDGRGFKYLNLTRVDKFKESYYDGDFEEGFDWHSTSVWDSREEWAYNNDDSCLGRWAFTLDGLHTSKDWPTYTSRSDDSESDVYLGTPSGLSWATVLSKTKAVYSYENPGPYWVTDSLTTTYTLSNPIGIQIEDPEDVIPGLDYAYKLPDGRYQATTVIGRTCPCPGKYEAILFYKEYPLDGSSPVVEPQEQQLPPEEIEITEDDYPNGKEIELPLPNTECTRTVFVRMELRPKDENCTSCTGSGGGGGSGGPGGGSDTQTSSRTSTGPDKSGHSSGDLTVSTAAIDSHLYSARALTFTPRSSDAPPTLVRATDRSIRQIHAAQALVDISQLLSGTEVIGYEVAFYPPPGPTETPDSITGLYAIDPMATPFSTVRYEDPDAGNPSLSGTRLRVTRELAGATPKVSEYEVVTNGVSLTQGEGLVRSVRTTTQTGTDTTEKVETYTPDTATTPDHVTWTIYRDFPFGRRLIEESRGTGSSRVWTTLAYDESSSSPTFGFLMSKISSDGGWERYEYTGEGRLAATTYPLGDAGPATTDSAQLRRVEKIRSSVGSSSYGAGNLTTTVDYTGGVEVTRSHRFERAAKPSVTVGGSQYLTEHEIHVQASAPGSSLAWDDSSHVFSHRYFIASGPHKDRPALEIAADGTVSLYRYSEIEDSGRRLVERWSGVPESAPTASSTPANIVAGTRDETITTEGGYLLSEEKRDAATGLFLSSLTYADHDDQGRPRTILHLDGSEETREYNPCCGQLTRVTHRGVTTTYGYDALGRRSWEKVEAGEGSGLQVISETRYTHDSSGRVLTRSRVPYVGSTPGTPQLLDRSTYDDAGTLLSVATPASLATDATLTRVTAYASTYDSGTGRTTRTVTHPVGATEMTLTDRSGRTLSRTGTAVAPVRHEYGTATLADAAQWGLSTSVPVPFNREIKLDALGADTAETLTTYRDFLGRAIKVLHADGAVSRSFYDTAGRLVRRTDPDGVQTLHAYIPATASVGEIQISAVDHDRDGVIDYDGLDRITRTTVWVAARGSGPARTVRRSTVEVWEGDNNDSPTVVSMSESSVDGLYSWETAHPLSPEPLVTARVTAFDSGTGERTDTVTHPDATTSLHVSVADRSVSATRKDAANATITQTTYGHDAHGRLSTQTLVGVGTTTTTYYADDRAHTVTTPDPDALLSGPGYDPQTTTYAYDSAGRVSSVTHPDATQTFTTYWPTGAVKRTWGSRTYPSEYAYDAQGRVKTLTTWQDFATESGAAVTTWNYDSQRGWLVSKRHADAAGPDYAYWPSGRLKTRDWARSVSSSRLRTSYAYNDTGDLSGIDYADATPDVAHTYDRAGRLKTTTDAAGVLTRAYESGRLDDETYASGSAHLSGFAVTRALDSLGRPASLGATSLAGLTYGYDSAGRLGTITQGARVASFGYKPAVGAHQSTGIEVSGVERYGMERTSDALGRISRVDTTGSGVPRVRRDYAYDAANRRTEVVHEDALRWATPTTRWGR